MDHQIPAKGLDLLIINKKRNCRIMDFEMKNFKSGKINSDVARELKMQWNMGVTVI